MPVKNVADRAASYAIPGTVVDGNDSIAVYEAVSNAVDRARAGDGPSLVECKTFLWRAHGEGYPLWGVDPAELERWKARCPIKRLKGQLLNWGVMNERELAELETQTDQEIENAARFALESPFPKPEEALDDVYA